MKRRMSNYAYFSELDVNYRDEDGNGKPLPPPRHLTVYYLEFVKERVFHPQVPEVLLDYFVTYEDGCTDCRSFSLIQPLPIIGEYYERITPYMIMRDGDRMCYSTWKPTQEEICRT